MQNPNAGEACHTLIENTRKNPPNILPKFKKAEKFPCRFWLARILLSDKRRINFFARQGGII